MPIRTSGEELWRKSGKFLFEFMNSSGLSFNVLFSAREEQIVERYKNLSQFKQLRKLVLLVEDLLSKFFFFFKSYTFMKITK